MFCCVYLCTEVLQEKAILDSTGVLRRVLHLSLLSIGTSVSERSGEHGQSLFADRSPSPNEETSSPGWTAYPAPSGHDGHDGEAGDILQRSARLPCWDQSSAAEDATSARMSCCSSTFACTHSDSTSAALFLLTSTCLVPTPLQQLSGIPGPVWCSRQPPTQLTKVLISSPISAEGTEALLSVALISSSHELL